MVAAAAIALLGVAGGLVFGRRQVRDQAQVEHGQWLRGQRQEAFVDFLTVWDETIPKFENRVLSDRDFEHIDSMNGWEDANNDTVEAMETDRKTLQRAADRVQMLGPEAVEQSVNAMLDTVANLALGIGMQYGPGTEGVDNLNLYWDARSEAECQRTAFVEASRSALRRTPDTGQN